MTSLNLPGTMDREFGGGGARQNVQNLRYRERTTSQDFSEDDLRRRHIEDPSYKIGVPPVGWREGGLAFELFYDRRPFTPRRLTLQPPKWGYDWNN